MANNDPTRLSIARAASQGYLLLPSLPDPVSPGTGFSTERAATPTLDPFITLESAFDIEALNASKFVYRTDNGGPATVLLVSTSSSRTSSEHLSVAGELTVGNAILGGTGSGSYNKAALEDKSLSKMSRKTSYQAGAIQFQRPPPLSSQALQVLQEVGIDAFKKRYGDFYVAGFLIGGDAAVLVSQATKRSESMESLKAKIEVQLLVFSKDEEIDESTVSFSSDVRFGLTAFNSLDGTFADYSEQNGNALRFVEAQKLAVNYAAGLDRMPARIEETMARLRADLGGEDSLTLGQMNIFSQSNVVSRLVMASYLTHREVRPYVFM